MGSDLQPYRSPSPVRARRQLSQEVQQVRGQALLRAARTEAIGFVATVGLHQIAGLSALEGDLIRHAALGESRYAALADAATMAIIAEISRMSWQ